jgi:hypothetical protein
MITFQIQKYISHEINALKGHREQPEFFICSIVGWQAFFVDVLITTCQGVRKVQFCTPTSRVFHFNKRSV